VTNTAPSPTPGSPPPPPPQPRPSGHGRRGEPAGFVTRGAAYVIDAMVIVLLLSVTSFALDSISTLLSNQTDSVDVPAGIGTTFLTVTAMGTIYFTLGWWLFGRTVGKLVLGVRVVSASGQRPGFLQSLVRAFGYLLSSFFLLGFAWIGLTPRRRGWHDHLARTWVVYDWAAHRRQIYDDDPLPPRA
jgi:uncharacterized RDD family membrane protein YckC